MTLLLALILGNPVTAPMPGRDTASLGKGPKDFVEIPQSIQYEGDYSPPVGRPAPPEASPFIPVRAARPWEKDIPVIVKPKPRYIDEAAPNPGNGGFDNQGIEEGQDGTDNTLSNAVRDAASNATNLLSESEEGNVGSNPPVPPIQPLKTPGSATGSKATVKYATTPGFTP